jgi:alcohol dehydrogenase
MPETMRAARMHAVGGPMSIDTIAVPKPGSTDVLVQVKACGMVPNLGNVLANWTKWFPHLPLPKLPAIFGLDPAGVVVEVGAQVIGVKPGQRVYVNRCGPAAPARCARRASAIAAATSPSTAISASGQTRRKSTISIPMVVSASS